MEWQKKLPIGIEYFKDFKRDGFYYVDKTGLIRDLVHSRGSVNLITRPRRFGKSLNIDMLKTFFELGTDPTLFDGLEISKDNAICEQYMGKYPVISISLKDAAGLNFQMAYDMLGSAVSEEAERFAYLLNSKELASSEKRKLTRLMEGDFEKPFYLHSSLRLLTRLLCKHHKTPVIVFIDEYDVPLDKAYQYGYYPEMANLIRSLFSQVLKTNEHLYFAVITGCLRIAKESIFTGLNNFKVRTISDIRFASYFGFTVKEIKELLHYYHLEEKFDLLKEWYDGYRFGMVEVYCPWDVINQCDKFLEKRDAPMEAHWENSSRNAIVQNLLETATETTKSDVEALISGEAVKKALLPELTYTDLDSKDQEIRQACLWSILFATGYLTDASIPENGVHSLIIPNREVLGIYEKRICSWFKSKTVSNTSRWSAFCDAVKTGNHTEVQHLFNTFMSDSISIRDTYVKKELKENFYHGMILGLLRAEGSWRVKSNAESGIGYMDIQLEIPSTNTGCIIEVKYAEKGQYDLACAKAMEQIEKHGYAEILRQDGMQKIHKYGIACYKKSCKISYCLEHA
ncbi:MAG: ATP-binding protein [Eubacterium sp.]|nr:ATP-binding protein [Eubacterium sp.]